MLVGLVGFAVTWCGTGEREAPTIAYELTGMSELEVHGGSVVVLAPLERGQLEAAAAEIRDRGVGDARVSGERIELELPGSDPRGARLVAETLVSGGEVRFHWVISSSAVMESVARRADLPAGIQIREDVWVSDATGTRWTDHYLEGERAALEAFIATLDPGPGHQLALEDMSGWEPGRAWRSYVIESEALLDQGAIDAARVALNPTTGQPEVLADFTREGGEIFARETGANIGRKLAIVRGEIVASAPVVQDRIAGGRISITMGRRGPQMAAAETLAALLDNGPLSHRLALVDVREVAPSAITGAARLARPLFAGAVGLALFALAWLIARFSKTADRGGEPAGRAPWLRAAVTAGGLGLIGVARNIGAPGLGADVPEFFGGAQLSIVGLGLAPVIAAFIAVELVALAIPRLRAARHDPARRGRLNAAAAIVAAALAVGMALLLRRWIAGLNAWALMAEPGLRPALLMVLTMAAGAMFLMAVAGQISRHGLGNGYAVVIGGAAIWEALAAWRRISGQAVAAVPFPTPAPPAFATPVVGEIAVYALAMVAAAAVTAWIFRRPRGAVPRPTAGIVPLPHPGFLAAAITTATIAGLGPWRLFRLADLSLATNPLPLLYLGVVAVLGVGLSLVFVGGARPGSTRALPSAGQRAERRRDLVRAIAASVAFLLAVGGLELAISRYAAPLYLGGPVIAVVATAVVLDVVGEWRFRRRHGAVVAAWPLHRLDDVDLALGELERGGIPAFARSRHFRALYHLFAPFSPVEILVPAADAERAGEVCHSIRSS